MWVNWEVSLIPAGRNLPFPSSLSARSWVSVEKPKVAVDSTAERGWSLCFEPGPTGHHSAGAAQGWGRGWLPARIPASVQAWCPSCRYINWANLVQTGCSKTLHS